MTGLTSWLGAMRAALLVPFLHPATCVVGLAGFLARGGVVLLALPIVVLPTPTGLQNELGPAVGTLAFGAPSPALVAVIAGAVVAAVLALLLGTCAGAWAEGSVILVTLQSLPPESVPPGTRPTPTGPPDVHRSHAPPATGLPYADRSGARPPPRTVSVAALRLLGLLPLALALVLAWGPGYDAAYRELVLPDDLATPLVVRVVRDVPWLAVAVALAWIVGDAAASVAVRRLVLVPRPLVVTWLLGWADLVRRPHRVLGTELLGIGLAVLLLAPGLVAVVIGWEGVRAALAAGGQPLLVLVTVVLVVTAWLATLALAGVGAAVRGAAATLEVVARR